MILNLTIVVLYVVNLLLRIRSAPDAAAPFWLSVVGVGLLAISGYLGGSLVFEERVAVAEPEAGHVLVGTMELEAAGMVEHPSSRDPNREAPRRAG